MKGVVFDIKEFAVFDGPGIRTTVFLKGCPLRCTWCHNPEGLSAKKQLMVKWSQCLHCGKCMEVCQNPKHCILCGDCILSCPLHLRRICGTEWESADLNEMILQNLEYLKQGSLPFMIRIPLIPGITDTEENLEQTASLLERSRNLLGVELLPYHQTAGAKYGMIGRAYQPGFQEDQMPREDTSPFLERGIPCRVL